MLNRRYQLTRTSKLLLAAVCLALGACQEAAPRAAPKIDPPPAPAGNLALGTDVCVARLEEIGSLLLQYYVLNKKFPAALTDLKPLADAELTFTCPTSNLPYVYEPNGLFVAGQDRVLILYDATAVHDGMRWGLVLQVPEGERPMTMAPVKLPQKVLEEYLKSKQ